MKRRLGAVPLRHWGWCLQSWCWLSPPYLSVQEQIWRTGMPPAAEEQVWIYPPPTLRNDLTVERPATAVPFSVMVKAFWISPTLMLKPKGNSMEHGVQSHWWLMKYPWFLTHAGRDRVALCDWRPWILSIEVEFKFPDRNGIDWVNGVKWFERYDKP